MKMQGKYFRIGRFDLWLGHEAPYENKLHISWSGVGDRNTTIDIFPETIQSSISTELATLSANTSKGKLEIHHKMKNTTLKLKWYCFPVISIKGEEYSKSGRHLIYHINRVNKS